MSIEAIGAAAPTVAMDVQLSADSSKPAGLHSPPDSNKAMDVDSDSELSDLDDVANKLDALKDEPTDGPTLEPKDEPEPASQPEVEDIGEVLPDHWSGTVPVFKPTMNQFRDFKQFVRRCILTLAQPCPLG